MSFRRTRSRPSLRPGLLLPGLLALACAWLSPLPRIDAFSAHMSMHMLVVACAAPLLALGIAGGPFDPVRRCGPLFPPVPVSLIELAVIWIWHTPGLHLAARHSIAGLMAEQGSFLLCGLLIWLSCFGGDPAHRAGRAGAGVAALLLTSMHMTFLGALIALAPRPLYAHKGACAGLTVLEDQQLGGAVMLIFGGVVYLAGGLSLVARIVSPATPQPEPER